ncbi:hypothetical protein [Bacillus sp. KH172YL63]|uniref:hypothetical protein n=1 Tax=Bacillus sp. KH172YL63 TaxID=2709784 RepID=UPI0013E4F400|nr:hypothetical protein [Bacillus sp. KH172YL63]BCB03072.1 hypothetical protein KH172YL63_12050 [Bacillus sp. KH172YL63]
MGYIAPIPHHQYKQYQEREMKVEKNPFSFYPIHPVQPLKNKLETHSEDSGQQAHASEEKAPFRPFSQASVPSSVIAEFTGKGRLFNEYV